MIGRKKDPAKKEPVETKKCKKCLRRVDVNRMICPHCGAGDFQFDNE